jgi:uncharacterized ion transporter superfamily protein YfcC
VALSAVVDRRTRANPATEDPMRFQLPHPLVLLLGGVAVAAALTWVLPSGAYERRTDAASGRELVVPGTYKAAEPAPVSIWGALMAVPRGIVAGADVILTILVVGGAFALLDATGALGRIVGSLVGRTRRPRLVIVFVCLAFATLGALENMQEEVVALIPVLLVLSRGLGFGAVTAVGMSAGSCAVGAAFGPTNPYQAGIALRFAELPTMTLPGLRFTLLAVAVALWILYMLWSTSRDDVPADVAAPSIEAATRRDVLMLAFVLIPFGPYVYGVLRLDWGFNELSALFLISGFAVGIVAGKGISGTASAFLKSMETVLAASLFVGVARAISVVMTDGMIIDTIVHGLATPLEGLPGTTAALLMIPVQAIMHIPVPSVSGQAVLTMPIMAPLSDLLGISRDAATLAFSTGAGLMDLITPTNGALLAVLLSAKVSYSRWLKFAIPGALLVAAVGVVGVVLAR